MNKITAQLVVFFEDPFWVGIYERTERGQTKAAKILFGAEPKSYDVYEYLNRNWDSLKFSPAVESGKSFLKPVNPKRLQREIGRQLSTGTAASTKAQQALKLQQEQNNLERRQTRKKKSEAEKEKQYAIHKQKKKEKHRGH